MDMVYLVFCAAGLAGAFLQTAIGFGSAIVMMNIFPFFLDSNQSVIICQITCIVLSSSILIRCFRHIQWKVCLPTLIPSLIVTSVCSFVSASFDAGLMKTILGFLFIALSIYFSLIANRIHLKPTIPTGIAMGIVSGAANGFFSMGGPPAVLYFAPSLEDKIDYLATTQFFFLATNAVSLCVRLVSGQAQGSSFSYAALSAAGALAGTALGYLLVSKLNAELVKRFIYAFIGINGLIIVLQQLI